MSTETAHSIRELRRHAFRTSAGDWCVPEPFVKQFLASCGVPVPAGIVVDVATAPSDAAAAAGLREPLVLKCWGPGIIHKSELGAVRVGVAMSDLDQAASELLQTVARHGIEEARLYVEEMAATGIELLFGVVAKPPFGSLATIGIGGTSAEILTDVTVKLCPLSDTAAADMIDNFRGAALLQGYRGAPVVDRESLLSAVVAIAGVAGVVDQLGDELAEFECNPIFVSASGVVAADARLILRDPAELEATIVAPPDLTPLFAPRSVAVVGASPTRSTWGNDNLAKYRELGWTDTLFAVHPTAASIDGVPAYPTLADVPGGVDHALITVSTDLCAQVLRQAGNNVRTAVINADGFAEAGPDGVARQADLLQAARDGGVRFLGPNCMGFYSPKGRQWFKSAGPAELGGHVGAVFQSGGLAVNVMQVGATVGLRFSAVASMGNAADIGVGDVVAHMLHDPDTTTIGIHIEGGADRRLVQVIREARGVKPVVLLIPGLSTTGSRVAASHTGALTSERRAWTALAEAAGATLTETFEHFLAAVQYLDRYRDVVTHDDSVLIVGVGGGSSVMAADACDAHDLRVPELPVELQTRLAKMPVAASCANPLDMPVTAEMLDLVLDARPFGDVLVNVDVGQQYLMSRDPNRPLRGLIDTLDGITAARRPGTRFALVLRNLTVAPGIEIDEITRLAAEHRVPAFLRLDDAATAIAAAQRFDRHARPRTLENTT